MPDIFDQLTRDFPQQEGDIFDQTAPDSDESSSSRGASSISAPRSPVAAQSTTSAATNPAPGSTAFAPQPSSQGQKAGAPTLGPLAAPGSALPNVAPAVRAQSVSARNNPPVPRPPARQTIAPPIQQQNRVIQQPQAPPTKQAPASASKAMQQPNWLYIAKHPEIPEYRSLYSLALSHLSPEEKREIVNTRIAAYPENQPEELEPIIEPEMGVQMGTRDVGPRAQAAMEQHSPVPQSAMPALATAKKYAVDPFEEMAAAGGDVGKEMLVGGAAAMTEGTSVPQPGDAVDPESGLPLPNPEDYTAEKQEKFRRDYPRTAGILAGIGEFAGSTVADPRSWPLLFAGPEVAGERFLSRGASPTLSRVATAVATAQTGVGAAQQAAHIHEIWNRRDIPLDEKYEAIAGLILNAITITEGVRDAIHGEPGPQALDPRLVAEINAMGDEAKRQVFSHMEQKVAREQASQSGTQTQKLPSHARRSSGPVTTQQARTSAGNSHNVPAMGHGMTAESPAVRRVKAEARPVRGQDPTVKVKQEPPAVQAALTQPPAPVRREEASHIGQSDPQSGRTILQPSNDVIQNERLANQAAPGLDTRLSRIADSVPGAKFDRLRPQKGLERLREKVADGKPPGTIGDNLAAQIVAPNPEAKDQLIAHMKQEFPVLGVDDKFTEPRDKAGYPSANVQVQMPNGGTAEVQIVAPEIQAITDQTHRLYTKGRNFPEGSAERAHYWSQAAAMHTQALEKFKARNAQEQLVNQLAPGQRVVLKSGQTGKIVGFADKTGRIVVRTSKGVKTVKPEQIQTRITRFDPTQA